MRGKRQRARTTKEAVGERTFDDIRSLLQDELNETYASGANMDCYVWVVDITDAWVVYEVDSGDNVGTWQADYTIDDGGEATLADPKAVQRVTTYEPATESTERIAGRVKEAKGIDDRGGHIYGVQIIEFGQSRNGNLYPPDVMREAAPLYEGAKAFDHHRTDTELRTSTVEGLVGSYRNVSVTSSGLEADLHLLPSAVRITEAFDASIAAQADGLPPIIGISHDVQANFRPVDVGGRRFKEATKIASVLSADVVADPAAGGRAIRMVAGGTGTDPKEQDMPVTLEDLKGLFGGATPEERAEIAASLGFTPTEPDPKPEDPENPEDPEAKKELVAVGATESMKFDRNGILGKQLVRAAVADAKLDERLTESVLRELPERFTEDEATRSVAMVSKLARAMEADGLEPRVKHEGVQVKRDAYDKRIARVDATFGVRQTESGDPELVPNARGAYNGFRQMWADFTQADTRAMFDIDPAQILRECYDGAPYEGSRVTESVDTATFGKVLGDSITRRLIAEYARPNLQTWRAIVSSIVSRSDFRTVRLDRLGGYPVLPAVNQSAPYQPLTTPTDEEVTYAITKRGGTEDLTMETIANDDLGALVRIPQKLGIAAARTLYKYVWEFLNANPTIYDSTALFTVGHANLGTSALTDATLSAARKAMRIQPAYGDTSDILSIVPQYLVVPPDLEEMAFWLTNSAVAVGTNAGTATGSNISNLPNLHAQMQPIVVDYWTDTNDWYVVADPTMCPTIELGFFQGRQDPELFVQDDPKVGSVFNADKITYKIRHIYAGAVVDYRGMYQAHV